MNTTGFLRGYMAKNMKADQFIKVAAEAISREFKENVEVTTESPEKYEIIFKGYKAEISSALIEELKEKSPYAVDKYLLEEFRKQGLCFNEDRSQYIRCCFGII